jgi:hypothetical protein
MMTGPRLARTEPPGDSEGTEMDVRPMGFAECIEIIRNYEKEVGPSQTLVSTPQLQIVEFLEPAANEEIACDGEDNVMSEFDLADD